MSFASSTSARRVPRVLLGAAVLAFGLTACAPDPAPPTTGATITVSKTENLVAGDVVTVTGEGFTTTGNTGSRPPLLNEPAGVYVVFGRFAETWQPSAGAGGRTIAVQKWAVPESSRQILVGFPWLQDPASFVVINPDGSFTATLTVTETGGTDGYGFAVYPGSGASNTGEEILVRANMQAPAAA